MVTAKVFLCHNNCSKLPKKSIFAYIIIKIWQLIWATAWVSIGMYLSTEKTCQFAANGIAIMMKFLKIYQLRLKILFPHPNLLHKNTSFDINRRNFFFFLISWSSCISHNLLICCVLKDFNLKSKVFIFFHFQIIYANP